MKRTFKKKLFQTIQFAILHLKVIGFFCLLFQISQIKLQTNYRHILSNSYLILLQKKIIPIVADISNIVAVVVVVVDVVVIINNNNNTNINNNNKVQKYKFQSVLSTNSPHSHNKVQMKMAIGVNKKDGLYQSKLDSTKQFTGGARAVPVIHFKVHQLTQ